MIQGEIDEMRILVVEFADHGYAGEATLRLNSGGYHAFKWCDGRMSEGYGRWRWLARLRAWKEFWAPTEGER